MVDSALIERLGALDTREFIGEAWRHVRPEYPPLSGEGARAVGGRWNPPGSYPTLYLGLDVDVVVAEFHRHLDRQGLRPEDALPRVLYRYEVRLSLVVDLRAEQHWGALDLDHARIKSNDLRYCQAVGDAAHYLGAEGLLAPSAAGRGDVIAVFLDRQYPASTLKVVDALRWDGPPPSVDRDPVRGGGN